MTFPYEVTVQSMRDIKSQAPDAICELTQTPVAINLLVNREAPPFSDPEIRRAMQLAIDRKSFIDILAEGQGDVSGAMQPPPGGLWGLPPEILQTLPGYGPDAQANRAEARKLIEKHGYGPQKRLPVKVATRTMEITGSVRVGGLPLAIRLSPDGKLLGSGSGDRFVRLWDVDAAVRAVKSQIKITLRRPARCERRWPFHWPPPRALH